MSLPVTPKSSRVETRKSSRSHGDSSTTGRDSVNSGSIEKPSSKTKLKNKIKPSSSTSSSSNRPSITVSGDITSSKAKVLLSAKLNEVISDWESKTDRKSPDAQTKPKARNRRSFEPNELTPTKTSERATRFSRSFSGATLVPSEDVSGLDTGSEGDYDHDQKDYASDRPGRSHRTSPRMRSPHINEDESSLFHQMDESPSPSPRPTQSRSNDEEATGSDRSNDSPSSSPRTPHPRRDQEEFNGSPAEAATSPEPVETPLKPIDIHNKLRKELKAMLTPADRKQVGYIYVAKDTGPNSRGWLKIGFTGELEGRKQTIRQSCGVEFGFVHSEVLKHPFKAEKLVQTELLTLRKPFQCPKCTKKHGEWFEVDEKLAKEVVGKWVRFLKMERPYYWNRKLKPLWHSFFENHEPKIDEKFDSQSIEAFWKVLRSPTYLHHYRSGYCNVREHPTLELLWKCRWRMYPIIAWLVTFSSIGDKVTLVAMLVSTFSIVSVMAEAVV